jgi:hypothetical protein
VVLPEQQVIDTAPHYLYWINKQEAGSYPKLGINGEYTIHIK